MSNKFKMYLISHSHTDIGYTDRQEKITRYHVDFIKQVIKIFEAIESDTHPEWEGFKWTCENYWQVEQFMKSATPAQIEQFNRYVLEGKIDVSLNYLNMTELVDDSILHKKLAIGHEWANQIGFNGDSAMTADINGYSWGYPDALLDNGITNLFSCVHGHHGLAPLRRQQRPFFWKTQTGKELFVWNGDHYMLGNEFLLIPNTRFTYHLKDEFENDTTTEQFEVTKKRIFKYIESLKKYGYQYNFVPIMISGVLTDNAPANGDLMNTIKYWNSKFGDEVELEMITLNDFFKVAREEKNIPTFEGDWNDWWADGVGSTPAATKIYKDAQRKYHLGKKLAKNDVSSLDQEIKVTDDNLMMYAEHTWGYSSSISEPWNTLVNDLEYRKVGYATQAHVAASKNLDHILSGYGEVSIYPEREKLFKVVNPHNNDVTEIATLLVEHWEHVEGKYIDDLNISDLMVVDDLGNKYISQAMKTARATEINVQVNLLADEEKTLRLTWNSNPKDKEYRLDLTAGSEGVRDIKDLDNYRCNERFVENDEVKVIFNRFDGIEDIIIQKNGMSILNPKRKYAPFKGVYEKTPVRTNPVEERRVMGRNRKGMFVERSQAVLKNFSIESNGELFTGVLLDYELEGTHLFSVYLKIYKKMARITATVRVHKTSEWSPENLYLSLPFGLPEATTYIDKSGCLIRPGIDQLPGTNLDFYLLQNGFVHKNDNHSLFVVCEDAPLVNFGDLDPHEILLADENSGFINNEPAFSWMMNNYWETNFKADLGGFYEFTYSVNYLEKHFDNSRMKDKLEELSQGVIAFPI